MTFRPFTKNDCRNAGAALPNRNCSLRLQPHCTTAGGLRQRCDTKDPGIRCSEHRSRTGDGESLRMLWTGSCLVAFRAGRLKKSVMDFFSMHQTPRMALPPASRIDPLRGRFTYGPSLGVLLAGPSMLFGEASLVSRVPSLSSTSLRRL